MSQTYAPPPPATSATVRLALLAVWALFTAGALAFVAFLGTNAPYADEWEFVPALVGDEPAGPWLWKQHNEHRMVLPRAVVLAYFKATRDFRSGMVLQVLMLSALALVLMRLAARLRGGQHWADAFFPVSLLHVGHWENLVMGYQVCFVLYAVLTTAVGVVALIIRPESAFRAGLVAGVLVMLLALTGGSGLVAVVPLALWLGFVAVSVWRTGSRAQALTLAALAVAPFAYLALYFQGYVRPEGHPPPCFEPLRAGTVAGQVLGVSFGMGLSGVWWLVAGGMVALGILTLGKLLARVRDRAERLSVVGLVAVAAGVAGVAVAIGVGRSGFPDWGEMGLWSRYALLSWPLLALAYLAWLKIGPSADGFNGAKWVPIVLCVTAALAFPGNTAVGMVNGAKVSSDYAGLAEQARGGLPAAVIVRSEPFTVSHHAAQAGRAVRGIPLLRRERVGIFAR